MYTTSPTIVSSFGDFAYSRSNINQGIDSEYRIFKILTNAIATLLYLAVAFIEMSIITFNMRLTGVTLRRWDIILSSYLTTSELMRTWRYLLSIVTPLLYKSGADIDPLLG